MYAGACCVGEAVGPLTVTEAVPLAEVHALDVVKSPGPVSMFVNFVRVVQDAYPQILKRQIISSPRNGAPYYWLELVSPTLVFDRNVGPMNCVRMMLSSEGLCTLQVLLPMVRTVWKHKYNVHFIMCTSEVCVCVCACVRACVCMSVHTYVRACMCTVYKINKL